MSKKNNRAKDRRYMAYLGKLDKERQQKQALMKERKEARQEGRIAVSDQEAARKQQLRIKAAKKQRVEPVIGSEVKMRKMLARQMKGLSISGTIGDKRKINIEDSDSSSGDDIEEPQAMDVDQVLPIKTQVVKKKAISRSQHEAMKKRMRGHMRMSRKGLKGSRRAAREISEKREVIIQESKARFQ